ncbi:hypothetical protein [Cetobacterium sp.]
MEIEVEVAEILSDAERRKEAFVKKIYDAYAIWAAVIGVIAMTLLLIEITLLDSLHFEDSIKLAGALMIIAAMLISYTLVCFYLRHKIKYSTELFYLKEALGTLDHEPKAVIKEIKIRRKRATLNISYESKDYAIKTIKLKNIAYGMKTTMFSNITTREHKRYYELDINSYKDIKFYEKGDI